MSKIKIGAQVTAKESPTKVTVSGTFQGYELEDQEDSTSICGKVFYVKDGKQYLAHVYVDSIKVRDSEDERIRKWLIEMVEELRKANPTNAEHNENCSEAIAYLEKQKEQKPAEWSEEDEEWYMYLLGELNASIKDYCGAAEKDIKEAIRWFKSRYKSLRPQPHWKPSEEQINSLSEAIVLLSNLRRNVDDRKNLESLYSDLKKL